MYLASFVSPCSEALPAVLNMTGPVAAWVLNRTGPWPEAHRCLINHVTGHPDG